MAKYKLLFYDRVAEELLFLTFGTKCRQPYKTLAYILQSNKINPTRLHNNIRRAKLFSNPAAGS